MSDHGSNQYPRLPWERNLEMVHGGFIARPHGPDGGWARIYYDRVQVSSEVDGESSHWWVWVTVWRDRFSKSGHVAAYSREQAKQEAADAATVAYWDLIEATPEWKQPPPPPAPPPLPPDVVAFRKRIEEWIESGPTNEELIMELAAFQFANPPIFSKEEDVLARCRIDRALADKKWG